MGLRPSVPYESLHAARVVQVHTTLGELRPGCVVLSVPGVSHLSCEWIARVEPFEANCWSCGTTSQPGWTHSGGLARPLGTFRSVREVCKDPSDVRSQRCGCGNLAGSNGQSTRSVSRIRLHQITEFRQDAEQGRVQMTSSGLVCTVRGFHRAASQLLVGGGATQTARGEPLHADRFTAVGHHDTVGAVAVVTVRFGQSCGCQERPNFQSQWPAGWRSASVLSAWHGACSLARVGQASRRAEVFRHTIPYST